MGELIRYSTFEFFLNPFFYSLLGVYDCLVALNLFPERRSISKSSFLLFLKNILIEKKRNRNGEALSLQRMNSFMPRISEENEETVDLETESMTSADGN